MAQGSVIPLNSFQYTLNQWETSLLATSSGITYEQITYLALKANFSANDVDQGLEPRFIDFSNWMMDIYTHNRNRSQPCESSMFYASTKHWKNAENGIKGHSKDSSPSYSHILARLWESKDTEQCSKTGLWCFI